MIYLTEKDYATYIKDDHLNVISDNDNGSILNAELAAKEEMASYLSNRYNVNKIFIEVPEFVDGNPYTTGQFVFFQGKVYKCLADTTDAPIITIEPEEPEEEEEPGEPTFIASEDWEVKDERNKVVMMYLCDITLYHLHASINPRNIPELRGIRYDRAIQWLRDVSRLIINPDLPLIGSDEPDRVAQIRYGSNRKRGLRY